MFRFTRHQWAWLYARRPAARRNPPRRRAAWMPCFEALEPRHLLSAAPIAQPDAYEIDEENLLTVTALDGILSNDTDADNDDLTAVLVQDVEHGTLDLNADGSFEYMPDENFFGTDTFTYRANDGTNDSNVATVSITVNPVNDAPVAVNDSYSVNEDTALVGDRAVLSTVIDTLSLATSDLVYNPADGLLYAAVATGLQTIDPRTPEGLGRCIQLRARPTRS